MICQSCSSANLHQILSLGSLPLCNDLRDVDAPAAPHTCYPLELYRCADCTLVQLGYVPPPEVVFPASYPYTSGTTRQLRENFADLAREVIGTVELRPRTGNQPAASVADADVSGDLVVDIGSNDGTLLGNFAPRYRVLGITPENVGQSASVPTLQAYFSSATGRYVAAEHGRARVITCTNCFAHVPDPNDFLDGVTALLADDGIFVTESTCWLDTVQSMAFDTIYSEHARYLAVQSILPMLERHGLEVFRVRRIPTHGGSIRVFAARKGVRAVEPSVRESLATESAELTTDALAKLWMRVRLWRESVRELLVDLRGRSVCGVGAPSRASTLLSYAGITEADMPVIYETPGSHKIGKVMPGTRIRVEAEPEQFGHDQPDYLLILSHHIADELVPKLVDKGFRGAVVNALSLDVKHLDPRL